MQLTMFEFMSPVAIYSTLDFLFLTLTVGLIIKKVGIEVVIRAIKSILKK